MLYLTAISSFLGSRLGKFVMYALLVAAVYGSYKYVTNLQTERDTAVADAKDWKKKAEDLDVKVKEIDGKQRNAELAFKDLDDANIDLLCMARYEMPHQIQIEGPKAVPEVLEVVKYKDRVVPVTVQGTAKDRAISDQIGTQALSNSWKAYCIATDHKDDVCKPYRK